MAPWLYVWIHIILFFKVLQLFVYLLLEGEVQTEQLEDIGDQSHEEEKRHYVVEQDQVLGNVIRVRVQQGS